MTARGSVEARYQGRTLRADEVVYDTKTGTVVANGHVQLINPDGTAEFADHLEVDEDMKAGFARNFSARLGDNVKVAAATAVRRNANIQELNGAIYTPCEVCAEKPTPTWSVQADRIVQDKKRQLIYYKNAVIRVWGARSCTCRCSGTRTRRPSAVRGSWPPRSPPIPRAGASRTSNPTSM